eukprot:CAMPEP_0194757828 /NCGR_PEP_ID=MMETSP0323_2-20130528/11245_1 /TAXON_ID=2866 ORGANISM="Crypthecodinium cohnii, Strain Seligo" /NCGR_SAMPLE_ID=MMETSP0323_2 /ASSEMBLY_ACC=CAM_ASM_000346 /LENGTH=35 /DNA_ID= /DNA_START= /DNA_END= /DNA_ORIENTATION=
MRLNEVAHPQNRQLTRSHTLMADWIFPLRDVLEEG